MNFLQRQLKINKEKPLGTEETNALVYKAQAGDLGARNRLVERNIGLVYSVIRKHSYIGNQNEEDYFQEGVLGMMRAIALFDPTKGFAFSTYAGYWISQKAGRFMMENRSAIRLPVWAQQVRNDFKKIKAMHPDYTDEFIFNVLATEGPRPLGKETIRYIIKQNLICQSLDVKFEGSDENAYTATCENTGLEERLRQMDIEYLLKQLDLKERLIVKAKLNGKTLEEIGQGDGLSRERIRQIYEKAVEKMVIIGGLRKT